MSKSPELEDDTREFAASRAIAALPMYDLPQLMPATDAFWRAIAQRLQDAGLKTVPASLTRPDDYQALWGDPDLLLGQTCGYPWATQLKNSAQIIATPVYRSSGCKGYEHCSFFIVNAKAEYRTLNDLQGRICAINGYDSNTGMNLLRSAVAPIAKGNPFFRSVVVTGAHLKSLEAVADGRAGLAAIDCVSFALFQHFHPELTARVAKIGQSLHTAAPPYITSKNQDAETVRILRDVLHDVAIAPELESVRAALNIDGFVSETDDDYERLLLIEAEAAALGYAELR